MARSQCVHVKCDRCKREELQAIMDEKVVPDFEARIGDDKIVFQDLCNRCKETISNLWPDLKEWDRQIVTTLWRGQALTDNQAPPMNPAPDYSPPKPHSAAAAHKKL